MYDDGFVIADTTVDATSYAPHSNKTENGDDTPRCRGRKVEAVGSAEVGSSVYGLAKISSLESEKNGQMMSKSFCRSDHG
jgi:hypothetical protein